MDLDDVLMAIMERDMNKPSPDPRYYDSVNEQSIPEFNSASEDNSDNEEPPQLIKLPTRRRIEEYSYLAVHFECQDHLPCPFAL